MIDLQAVYVREVAELTSVRLGVMVRIEDVAVAGGTDVLLNGVSSEFFALSVSSLMVAIPASFLKKTEDHDFSRTAYGYVASGINNVQIIRAYTTEEGEEYQQTNTIVWDEGETVSTMSPAGTRRITLDTGVLYVNGHSLDKAVRVRVNNKEMPFLIKSPSQILTTLPENDKDIHAVDVITTAKRINRETFFEYMMGAEFRIIRGPFKLVQQFVKCLLTTPGSDVFNKSLGGNMQNWVGQRVNPKSPQTLVAKTIMNVVQVGQQMSTRQIMSNAPADERLSDVQVLNAQLDPNDPTMMNLSIKVIRYAGRAAFFSMIISEVAEFAENYESSGPTYF